MLNNVFECTECKSTQETLEDYSMQRCLVVGCEGVYNERFPDPDPEPLQKTLLDEFALAYVKARLTISHTSINDLPGFAYNFAEAMLSERAKRGIS